jgi:hypothetical protein
VTRRTAWVAISNVGQGSEGCSTSTTGRQRRTGAGRLLDTTGPEIGGARQLRWRHPICALHTSGVANGPTEAIRLFDHPDIDPCLVRFRASDLGTWPHARWSTRQSSFAETRGVWKELLVNRLFDMLICDFQPCGVRHFLSLSR